MDALRKAVRQRTVYFVGFGCLLCGLTASVINTGKVQSFLFLNSYHTEWLNRLCQVITFLGDGLFSILLAVLLIVCWKKWPLGLQILTAYLLSGLGAQIVKALCHAPRPKEIISANIYHEFIDGVTCSGWNSFPSGHATSAFALATVLALNGNRVINAVIYLLLATIVSWTRIYLGQHFLPDVMAGAVLGTLLATITVVYIPSFYPFLFRRKPALILKQDTGQLSER